MGCFYLYVLVCIGGQIKKPPFGLAAVFVLVGKDGVFGVFAAGGGAGDLLFEREIFAAEDGCDLSGLHTMMLRNG